MAGCDGDGMEFKDEVGSYQPPRAGVILADRPPPPLSVGEGEGPAL